jgi:hypothetical protein
MEKVWATTELSVIWSNEKGTGFAVSINVKNPDIAKGYCSFIESCSERS